MKIALMTNNYKPFVGGVPISVERLKKALTKLGHQVTVFAPTYEEQQAEEDVFRYASFHKTVMGGILVPNPFDVKIEREFAAGHFDIIHVHHPMLIGRAAVYLSKKYGIPLVFTYHTRYEQYVSAFTGTRALEPLVPLYLKSFLKHCDLVFTPTRGLSEYLEAACRVPSHKLEVLPTGLEEASYLRVQERIQRVRSDYQAFDCPLFLSVSRLSPEKNIDFLLESLALVKRRCKKPFKMFFAGDGPERKRYEERCRELGLSETVFFAGRVKNEALAPYYQAADAFLFASKTETQGIVILEAFAGETPVYALRATGVSDLVTEGVNGRLTEEKLSDYADKVIDFLEGREDVRKLSRNAYETALEYREEAVAICALRHYNRIIAVKEDCKISGIEGQQWRTTSITY